ncbi:hypothetical protein MM213_12140 [Belliella sp. R4-6]|uniref:PDZ domain-containing protein n=1 Tax=Belliella alkalica TaxID=1730871 RepID=A0ABS9VCS6_9BACT|nr:hypothetical protein [Belliella alkalica]MCH7414242.1 hypothetical protein [Belliella alkalica]
MKNLFLTLLLFSFFSSGFCKNPNEKTFLILFDKSELKQMKSSPEYIELSLMNLFDTKSYSGNSDAAIIVKTTGSIDKCLLGDFIIRLNQNTITTLEEVAFQIVDLDQSRGVYQIMLADFEQKIEKNNKKSNKFFKPPSVL